MARRKNFKTVTHVSTIGGIIDDARNELEELTSEIRDWADNMDAGGLSHTEKYQQVSECADALEYVELELEVPSCIEDVQVTYTSCKPYGRKAASRAMRCSNIQSALDAVTGYAEEFAIQDDDTMELSDDQEEVQEFAEHLSEAASNLEMIDFPGMY